VWPIRFQPQPDCPTAPTPLPCPRLRCTLTELRLSSLHVRRRLILCLHAPAPLSSCPSQQGAGHCPCLDLDGQRQLHLLVPRAGASSPTTYSTASAASTSRVRCLPGCSPHSASSPCARSHRLESTIEAHAATSSSRAPQVLPGRGLVRRRLKGATVGRRGWVNWRGGGYGYGRGHGHGHAGIRRSPRRRRLKRGHVRGVLLACAFLVWWQQVRMLYVGGYTRHTGKSYTQEGCAARSRRVRFHLAALIRRKTTDTTPEAVADHMAKGHVCSGAALA
jgi:hypothetical protein